MLTKFAFLHQLQCDQSRHSGCPVEPPTGRQRTLSRPPLNSQSVDLIGPEKRGPEMEEAALNQEMVNTPLLPPEEGWVKDIHFSFDLGPAVPTFSVKEQFGQPLGHTGQGRAVSNTLFPSCTLQTNAPCHFLWEC